MEFVGFSFGCLQEIYFSDHIKSHIFSLKIQEHWRTLQANSPFQTVMDVPYRDLIL